MSRPEPSFAMRGGEGNNSSTGNSAAATTATTDRRDPGTRRRATGGVGDAARQRRVFAERHVALWVLAASAGFIVTVCYAELSRVEVGPMTGNVVATGLQLGRYGAAAMFTRVVAVFGFVAGVAIGVVIAEECARHKIDRALALTLAVELVPLVAFTVWGLRAWTHGRVNMGSHWAFDGLVALPALAMGLQTAALRRVGGQTARTVYITGMLTRCAEEGVRYWYWSKDRKSGEQVLPWHNEPSLQRILLLAGIVVAFAAGSVFGGALDRTLHLTALVVPLSMIALVAVVDVVIASGPPSR